MATHKVARGTGAVALDQSAVRRWLERSCAEQQIDIAVTDERTIAHLVTLLSVEATGTLSYWAIAS
jgi:hypothetical protein